jgi:uridine kinase
MAKAESRRPRIVAIDGGAAAGKSTLAQWLETVYDCNVFHMDDFFLQPRQRTAERLGEAGGNVDYERVKEEIIEPLIKGGGRGSALRYTPYDCKTQTMREGISVEIKPLNIIEGVYSLHPIFGDIYDLRIFLQIDKDEQKRRLLRRGAGLYDRFVNEWLPMEEKYFKEFGIMEKCDIISD